MKFQCYAICWHKYAITLKKIIKILKNKQNLMLWQGNKLAAGFHYHIFKLVTSKLELSPTLVESFEASNNISDLPRYVYKDGSTKKGGRAKTDVALTVHFSDGHTKTYTFSCKSTTKPDVTVFQFPPKYCVDILDISEPDTKTLLEEYVNAGGPSNMPLDRAQLLTKRLAPYLDKFNHWVLHGTERDGSSSIQRADYIITRYQKKSKEEFYIETIDECIMSQYKLGKTHFGTAFKWTVTKKNTNGECFPALRIRYE